MMKSKKEKSQRKRLIPDEAFRAGGIEFARFGRVIKMRNLLSNRQHDELMKKLGMSYQKVVEKIDDCISQIIEIVVRYNPVSLLKRAWWQNASLMIRIKSEAEVGSEEALAQRMIDYMQSIIVSCYEKGLGSNEPTDDDWKKLSENIEMLFHDITFTFLVSRRARKIMAGEVVNKVLEDYYFKALIYWCNIRGKRYTAHNKMYFQTLLQPHETILQDIFKMGVDGVLRLVSEVENRHTRAAIDTVVDFEEDRKRVCEWIAQKYGVNLADDSFANAIEEAIDHLGLQERRDRIGNILFGDDLFELKPENGISIELLDALSLSPGEDVDFFAEGDFRGWPLRVWPVWRKPFLRIDGRHLCFDYYSFMDNLYRVLQRLIVGARPEYHEEWNRKQKDVSEAWPANLLTKILPGAVVRRNIFYPQPNPKKAGNWCELDALIEYDDALFVVEVKAGTFCREPPATDFDAYIRSLQDLIEKPSNQAARFYEYIDSVSEIVLYDETHCETARICRDDYRLIVPTTVSLDNLTELAAQAKHLNGLGIKVGNQAVWNVSIEDLMVFADIFNNPLTFLHFVELRLAAYTSQAIQLDDELDHIGLYLKYNDYVRYIENMASGGEKISLSGYRQVIDEYFYDLATAKSAPNPLEQKMHPLFHNVLDVMTKQHKPGFRRIASYLLSCDMGTRKRLWTMVDESLTKQRDTGRPQPITSYGDFSITVFCWEKEGVRQDKQFARRHALAAMCVVNKNEGVLLEVIFDRDGNIAEVDWSFLEIDSLDEQEKLEIEKEGHDLATKRIQNASKGRKKKIGRNEPCPCGSGKKFKKCHGQ